LTGGNNERETNKELASEKKKTSAKENLIGGDKEIEPCECEARRRIEPLATTHSGGEREEKLEPWATKALGSAKRD
jgi:hypothetical protein